MTYVLFIAAIVFLFVVSVVRDVRKHRRDSVHHPKFGRMEVHPILCSACKKPLLDGQLVAWKQAASGSRTPMLHAECGVVLKLPDGTGQRPDGTPVDLFTAQFTSAVIVDADQWVALRTEHAE